MKKFLSVCLMLFIGTVLFAQSADVKMGRTYTVKSTDGSGQVPLYRNAAVVPAYFVPEGTEFKVEGYDRNDIEVKYEDGKYYIRIENFHEETAESIAYMKAFTKRQEKKRNSVIIWIVMAAAGFVVISRMSKTICLKEYTDYYADKRRQFAWLESWIQKRGDNPAKIRAYSSASGNTMLSIIIFLVVGFILNLITAGSMTAGVIYLIIYFGVIFLITWRVKSDPGSLEPEKGLTLECPSCHCPHSWILTQREIIIEDSSTTTTKTTTTRETSGGDLVSMSQSILNDGTTTRVDSTTVYSGREIKDFKCLNCGHAVRNEYIEAWTDSHPDEGVKKCNEEAWYG